MNKIAANRGFTLIELAVVLMIIGFIAGGVIVGKSMIRSTQIQNILTDNTKFISAIDTFQQKYRALPGDLATATSYWGTNANCATGGTDTPVTDTCNGNGNGKIGNWAGWGTGTAAVNMERIYVWQHLVNAGLISGGYTGATDSYATTHHMIGQNVPGSSLPGVGYSLLYIGKVATDVAIAGVYQGDYGHALVVGSTYSADPGVTAGQALTSAETSAMDIKIDDGLPGMGKLTTLMFEGCITTASHTTAVYDLTSGSVNSCQLIFTTGF